MIFFYPKEDTLNILCWYPDWKCVRKGGSRTGGLGGCWGISWPETWRTGSSLTPWMTLGDPKDHILKVSGQYLHFQLSYSGSLIKLWTCGRERERRERERRERQVILVVALAVGCGEVWQWLPNLLKIIYNFKEAKDIDLKLSGDDAYSPQGSSQKSRMMLSSKSMVRYLQCPLSTPILDCPFLESNKVIFDIKDNPFLYVSNSFFQIQARLELALVLFAIFWMNLWRLAQTN